MTDPIFKYEAEHPIELFGTNNKHIPLFRNKYPKIRISTRGNTLIAQGDQDSLELLAEKIDSILDYFERYGHLTEREIELLLEAETNPDEVKKKQPDEVIVYGNGGKVIRPKTPNQSKLVETIKKKDMVFAVGPAGTGKTYTAVAMAVRALKEKSVRRIILTRPAVEAGENLGFLPGDLKEKLDPYLQPLYDALMDMIPGEKLAQFLEKGVIQIAPLAFMRGRTLDGAFVILDEAQNATEAQMKMFLTRMGLGAQFVITGDASQIDLPYKQKSGLKQVLRLFKGIKEIGIVELDGSDVVRHKVVKKILKAYDKEEQNTDRNEK